LHVPNPQRELVGSMVQYYRRQKGLELDDSASILGCDRSKISRIESGERGIRSAELRQLLTEYDVDSPAQDMLAALSGWRETLGWWHAYMRSLPSAYLAHVIPETFAARSLIYAPNQIPDLLRIREYDEAVVAADPSIRGGREDVAVKATSARKQVVLYERRTMLVVVIGEAALRQQVGGAEVLKRQLAHLAELGGSDYSWITIRILPFGAGAHAAGGTGGFSILQFDDIPELAITHLDGPAGGLCLHEAAITEAYVDIFWQLYGFTQGPTESVRKIVHMANR
jgi:transcriptional regulator with XRE-family HTH domain